MKTDGRPMRGVNLGGWFVLERWMTPSLFKGSEAKGERELTKVKGEDFILDHRRRFITEQDFKWMRENSIEAVRVPVGYWVLESQDGYVASPDILDWCFEMAAKYDIKILLGLHAAPGGQNSEEHGGSSPDKGSGWFKGSNRDRTTKVLIDLAKRYGDHFSLWGLSVLNEPTSFGLIRYLKLRLWTRSVVRRLRLVLPESVQIVFSDAYMFGWWRRVLPSETLDIHHYQCHGVEDRKITQASGHLAKLEAVWERYRRKLGGRKYIVGEWSSVLPPAVAKKPETKQAYIDSQIENFKEAEAIFYWNYKVESKGGWNYRDMVESGFKF